MVFSLFVELCTHHTITLRTSASEETPHHRQSLLILPSLSLWQPRITFWLCLFWTFHITEIISYLASVSGFFHSACLPRHHLTDMGLFALFGYCKQGCYEHLCMSFYVTYVLVLWAYARNGPPSFPKRNVWNCFIRVGISDSTCLSHFNIQ